MKIKTQLLAVFLVAFVLLGFPRGSAAAAKDTTTGVVISPPLIEQTVTPGKSFTGSIRVNNPNQSTSLTVDVSVDDFSALGEDGQQSFQDATTNDSSFSLGKWITIQKSFSLDPDATAEIPYTIDFPINVEPGGHYGVIFFSPTIANPTQGQSNVTAIPKVGALLLFTAAGDILYDGRIVQFSANKQLYLDSTNIINLLTRFENLGTNHIKPTGQITIKNIFGKDVATLDFNDKLANVLPSSIRRFENNWETKYRFGLYTAELSLAYTDDKSLSSTLSFWIIPWKETAAALILILLIIWLITYLRKHLRFVGTPPQNQQQ